jgi:hypothetical protein
VNDLFEELRQTQSRDVRMVCVTDEPLGLHRDIEVVAIPDDVRHVIETHGMRFAKVYLFSKAFRARIGEKFIYCDLDVQILEDVTYLCDRDSDLIVMEGRNGEFLYALEKQIGRLPSTRSLPYAISVARKMSAADALRYLLIRPKRWCRFNSSFLVIDPDQPDDLWSEFDGKVALNAINAGQLTGSDQAWLQLAKAGTIETVGKDEGFWFHGDLNPGFGSSRSQAHTPVRFVIFAGRKSKTQFEAARPQSAKANGAAQSKTGIIE